MNTNDFILPASKSGNYAKQKSKKLLDLRLETVHLEMENHEMEQKLHQLKLNMEKEKEERQFSSGHRWKSGQAVSLNYANQASLQSKDSSVKPSQVSSGRMRLKVLKDHIPEPVKQPVAPKSSFIASLEKTKIKGKACGQCENKCALLTCLECGEDYCVSCFSKIHQKGALKLHRTSPVQGKYVPIGKLDAARQFRKDIDLSPVNHDTKIEKSPLFKNISPSGTVPSSYSAESVSTLSTKPFHEKLDGGSLLHGTFNEEESSKSFKEILMDWRHGNPEYKGKQSSIEVETGRASKEGNSFSHVGGNHRIGLSLGRPLDSVITKPEQDFKFNVETFLPQSEEDKTKNETRPLSLERLVHEGQHRNTQAIIDSITGLHRSSHFDASTQNLSMLEMCRAIDTLESVGESEVQTLLTVVSKPVDIEFTDNGLNYLEKLLLKKHRRMPVHQLTEFRHSYTFLDESQWALNEEENGLTAEEMENHECYAALFRKQASEADPERSVSSLRIIELNDVCEEGLEVSTCFVVNEVDSNDSSSEQSVTVIKPQNNSLCFGEKSDSSPVHATERTRKPSHHSNYLVDKDNISNPSDGKKKRRSSTKIYEADSADSIAFITPEATRTSLHGTIDNSLRETVNCSAHDRAMTQNNSTKLDSHKRGSSHISPETTLNAFTVDSKDIPSTPRALKGNTQVVDLCNVHTSKGLDTSATTNSSMEMEDIPLQVRKGSFVSTYRGLEGFFILDVKPKEVQQESYISRKSEPSPVDHGILCPGNGQWRPGSSLSEYADDALVQNVVDHSWNRPSSSFGRHILSPRVDPVVYAPQSSRGYKSQRSLSANPARHICSPVSRPASAAARPLSRAASEILEIESIDITEQDDPLLEDDADQQTLTKLEKELIELKTNLDAVNRRHTLSSEELLSFRKNSKKKSMIMSHSSKRAVMSEATKVTISTEATESECCLSSSMSFNGESETDDDDEEEQSRQDKNNVMSLW